MFGEEGVRENKIPDVQICFQRPLYSGWRDMSFGEEVEGNVSSFKIWNSEKLLVCRHAQVPHVDMGVLQNEQQH